MWSAPVCDNLKAGVTTASRTSQGSTGPISISPPITARPSCRRGRGKPRDKAKVEAAVLVVERWILARLRNRRFFSLVELNAAIRTLLDELNTRLMRKLGASRREFMTGPRQQGR
jgi:hypothetical protein